MQPCREATPYLLLITIDSTVNHMFVVQLALSEKDAK